MKVGRPGSGLPPEAAGGPEKSGPAKGKDFAQKVGRGTEVTAPGTASAAKPVSASDPVVGKVSADLVAGRITPNAAVERVVNRILDQKVGAGASPAIRKSIETALRDAIESDPLLAEKIRALGTA